MTEAATYDVHPDAVWVEIHEPGEEVSPSVRRYTAENRAKQSTPTGSGGCRCWRCRGGVPANEKPILDRLLARHLLNMGWQEREEWIAGWKMSPMHTTADVVVLRRWIAIEEGHHLPEPVYPRRGV